MPLLNIDLMTPEGVLFEGNEIPDDLQSEELVSRLVNTLGLPRATASGEPIEYSLEIVNQGIKLQNGQTLGDAGTTNGDVLRLLSSHKIPKPPQPELSPEQATAEGGQARGVGESTISLGDGRVIVIRPKSSVTQTIRDLKDGMGLKTEDISFIDPAKLKKPESAVLKESRQGTGKRRTVMLATMAAACCVLLVFVVAGKNKKKAAPVPQESVFAQVQTPSPTPEPTLEPMPEPSIIPMPTPKPRFKPEPVVRQWRPKPTPVTVAQTVPVAPPEEPKKCGFFRKVFVGCKGQKKPKKEDQVGGVAGVVKSAGVSNGKTVIRRGVNYPTRRAIP